MKKDIWNALSSNIRREIIHLLGKSNLSAGEIANHFSLTKPTISHHLSILKEVNLIKSEKDKNSIIYHLNQSVMKELKEAFHFMILGKELYKSKTPFDFFFSE